MRCLRCAAENREGRRFCAECGSPLTVTCASCGFANEAGERFCGGCGQPLAPAATPAPAGPPAFASPDSYTPRHLAEKILTSKAALEGERKQVTVLFADVKGSMELLADRDPEEARGVLDPVLERMMDAVHRYEGTVNQVMGDGIMALFGAPLAHEDHAVRACYAALAMQESLREYGQALQRDLGVPLRIRVGLNSGEVVVRSIGSDLRMDYSAVGQTTHLAARMEQMAAPGSVLLTARTTRLAEGYVRVNALGPTAVKGLAEPVEVFELVGIGATRTRLQVSAAHGLTRFVGRRAELDILPRALEHASAGRGQVVAVVGEAGLGKSRLFWEFTHSPRTQGWLVLESRSVSYGKATTYLPVVELLKAYFHLEDRDDAARIREKVASRLRALDPGLEAALPPLLALLHVPAGDAGWEALDPGQRRQRTLLAVKALLLRHSRTQPLILVFEDLHWVDSESQAVLDGLVESLPAARILLLVNYRPEYRHGWAGKSHYTQLTIQPLGSESAEELLDALLGQVPDLRQVKRWLIERTGGNPFFLEESVRTLVETGALAGERGAYRPGRPLANVEIPGSVQAILAARIDRLSPEDKRLLQSASVIGKDVPRALLRPIAGLDDEALLAGLGRLQAAEFLYEMNLFPEVEYTFKHALTHEVAYAGLLHERRRALHSRMVEVIERLYPDRTGEQVERLALHACRGELWPKAVEYYRQAGAKALSRSAHPEAVSAFEQALAALGHLPKSREVMAQSIDVRFSLRNSLWPLGDLKRLLGHLREAEALAEALGDQRRLGQLSAYMAQFFTWIGEHDLALAAGRRTLAIAEGLGEFSLRVAASFRLGQTCHAVGRYRDGAAALRRNVQALRGDLEHQRFALTGLPSVLSRAWLVWSLVELGDFSEAGALAREAMDIAEAVNHPFDLIVACFGSGVFHVRRGEPAAAVAPLERALGLCETGHVPFWFPLVGVWLGSACARAGRVAEALPLIEQAVREHAAIGLVGVHSLFLTLQGDALLLAGRAAEAREAGARALELARGCGERGHEAWSLSLLGEVAAASGDLGSAEASLGDAAALAEELDMRPLLARCHLALAAACRDTGRAGEAERHALAAAGLLGPSAPSPA